MFFLRKLQVWSESLFRFHMTSLNSLLERETLFLPIKSRKSPVECESSISLRTYVKSSPRVIIQPRDISVTFSTMFFPWMRVDNWVEGDGRSAWNADVASVRVEISWCFSYHLVKFRGICSTAFLKSSALSSRIAWGRVCVYLFKTFWV